jgi:hypothetical protein
VCRTRESRRSILKLSSKDILIDIIRLTILGFREILIDNSDESSGNEDCITIRVTLTEKAMVIDVTPFAMFWYFQPFTLLGFNWPIYAPCVKNHTFMIPICKM